MIAKNERQIRVRLDWLLGFDSRLRSVSQSRHRAPCPRPSLEDRSCHGLCLLQGYGHTVVQTDGLDPDRIIKPQGPMT
jgi:hypothetical protein